MVASLPAGFALQPQLSSSPSGAGTRQRRGVASVVSNALMLSMDEFEGGGHTAEPPRCQAPLRAMTAAADDFIDDDDEFDFSRGM